MDFDLNNLRILADFGMCVVLWMVQLVIYPSFAQINKADLQAWHATYTFRISLVIMPLMFGQLGLGIWQLAETPSIKTLVYFIAVLMTWALTFFVSVPLHNRITQGEGTPEVIQRLIATNWPRTLLWSAIFLFSISL